MAQSARRSEDPLVIAHRGASGYLPEHTLPAYAFGYALGADYIEPDLVLTRDGVFICLHDIHLEATTDVEQRFPDRRRSDGRWYALDFDLAEIQSLNVHERLPGRYPQDRGRYQVPTFEEMIELVQGLNRSTGRDVGIYPELKAPTWHRTEGKPMEEAFLALLERHGYEGPDAMVFVQVFEKEPLRRMRELGSELPQVYLIGGMQRADLEEGSLRDIATFAQGIGPSKILIEADPTVVERAHAAGLEVHPYTFRADDVGEGYPDFEAELERFFDQLGVDGLFTDFPDRAIAVRER